MDVTCDRSNIFHESLVVRTFTRALPSDDLISTDCPHLNPGYKQTGDVDSAVDRIVIAESLSFLIKSVNSLWQCLTHYASHVMTHEPFLPDSSRHLKLFSAVSFKSWQWGSLDVWDLDSVMHSSYAALQLDFLQSAMPPQKTVTGYYGQGRAVHI